MTGWSLFNPLVMVDHLVIFSAVIRAVDFCRSKKRPFVTLVSIASRLRLFGDFMRRGCHVTTFQVKIIITTTTTIILILIIIKIIIRRKIIIIITTSLFTLIVA